jgi:hypothetical protein
VWVSVRVVMIGLREEGDREKDRKEKREAGAMTNPG